MQFIRSILAPWVPKFNFTCCSWYPFRALLTLETLGERMGRVLISRAVRVLRSPTVLMFLALMSCPKPLALQQGRENGLLVQDQGISSAGRDPQDQQPNPQPWGAFHQKRIPKQASLSLT